MSFITLTVSSNCRRIKQSYKRTGVGKESRRYPNGKSNKHYTYDDIILFGIGNIVEWKVYKKILDLFCKATGMDFSPQKSYFLEVGWKAKDLAMLKELMSFEVKPIEVGFKYLGCF